MAIKRSCNASQIIGDLFKKKLYYYRLVALIGLLSFTPFYYISNTKKKDSLYDGFENKKILYPYQRAHGHYDEITKLQN